MGKLKLTSCLEVGWMAKQNVKSQGSVEALEAIIFCILNHCLCENAMFKCLVGAWEYC